MYIAEEKRSSSLSEVAGNKIIRYIVDNKLTPGDKLPTEQQLVDYLEVSRSTVREATRRLVARNILCVRQGSGIFVAQEMGIPEDPLGFELLQDSHGLALDLIDVRLILEPEIAALTATHIQPNQMEQLENCHAALCDAIAKGKDFTEIDGEFHRLLAVFSGNCALAKLVPAISSSVGAVVQGTNNALSDFTAEHHQNIIRAVKRHDASGAKNMMIVHLSMNRESILKNMSR